MVPVSFVGSCHRQVWITPCEGVFMVQTSKDQNAIPDQKCTTLIAIDTDLSIANSIDTGFVTEDTAKPAPGFLLAGNSFHS